MMFCRCITTVIVLLLIGILFAIPVLSSTIQRPTSTKPIQELVTLIQQEKRDSAISQSAISPRESTQVTASQPVITPSLQPTPQSVEVDSVTIILMKMHEKVKNATIDDLSWIAGAWELRDRQGIIEEYWMRPSGKSMIGITRNVSENEPLFFEYLRILQTDSGIIYIAQPSGWSPIEFKLVELEDEIATFINPAHDFPQRIIYRKELDNILFVRLEGTLGGKFRTEDLRYRRVTR